MKKTIYLAGKIDSAEVAISEFARELEERGHSLLEKWWEKEVLPKPYLDHTYISAPAAQVMIDAAYSSDVCILFPENKILGASIEFGAALASTKNNSEKQIIIVNPFEVRQSIFYAHPQVLAVSSINDIRDLDWY